MPDQFFQDKKSTKVLKQFFKKAPKAFQRVSAGTLNGLAFDEKSNFSSSIARNMTIRSPGLLKKLIRVKTTPKSKQISAQESRTFTTTFARHEGWEATAKGGQADATKFTDAGRAGNKQSGKAKKGAKSGGAFTTPSDVGFSDHMSKRHVVKYLQRISKTPSRRRKSFLLPVWYKRIPPGIYRFVGGTVKRSDKRGHKFKRKSLHGARWELMSVIGTVWPVKNLNWQAEATKMTTKESNVQKLWVSNFNHELNKIKIR